MKLSLVRHLSFSPMNSLRNLETQNVQKRYLPRLIKLYVIRGQMDITVEPWTLGKCFYFEQLASLQEPAHHLTFSCRCRGPEDRV